VELPQEITTTIKFPAVLVKGKPCVIVVATVLLRVLALWTIAGAEAFAIVVANAELD
jgi:hypothetical protein